MKKILILLFFVVYLHSVAQQTVESSFKVVPIIEDSSDCFIIWYAHSGKDTKTIIKKDTQEIIRDDNQMYYIKKEENEYCLIRLL